MSFRLSWVLPFVVPAALAALAASSVGCTPKIGNSCNLSTDCSQLGDRLCDGSQPGGYCTIFNCAPDTCPSSVCVAFDPSLDPACKSADLGRAPRFERTFCLKACNSDGDCRADYACIDLSPSTEDGGVNPNLAQRRAQVVDVGALDGGSGYSVCMALALGPDAGPIAEDAGPIDTSATDDAGVPAVCRPFQGFPMDGGVPWTPYDGGQ